MPVPIPDSHLDLLNEPVAISFTTLMPDGQPQSSVVWGSWNGEHILINTAKGRQKDTNVANDTRVNCLIIDPDNMYRYLEVRGVVVKVTEEGALEHINAMAQAYRGVDEYYGGVTAKEYQSKETRILLFIEPQHIVTRG